MSGAHCTDARPAAPAPIRDRIALLQARLGFLDEFDDARARRGEHAVFVSLSAELRAELAELRRRQAEGER